MFLAIFSALSAKTVRCCTAFFLKRNKIFVQSINNGAFYRHVNTSLCSCRIVETPTDASGTEVTNDEANAFCFASACTAHHGDVLAIDKIIPEIVFIYIY